MVVCGRRMCQPHGEGGRELGVRGKRQEKGKNVRG